MSQENETTAVALVEGAQVSVKTREALGHSAPWLRFLGILGYIGLSLLILVGIGLFIFGLVHNSQGLGDTIRQRFMPYLGIFYVMIAVVMFIPLRFLMRMAKASKIYKVDSSAANLELFAVNFRKLVKFYGITTIVILAVYLLALLGFVIFLHKFFS